MDEFDIDQYLPHDPQEEEFEEECGLMPDGTCLLAGTEHCDWDCGALNEQRIEAMKEASNDD